MKIEDKLLDLYGISQAEATFYWKDLMYVEALRDKVDKAKKLQAKLLKAPMMKRDISRIKRIGDAIVHNNMLISEVNNGNQN